MIYQPIQIEHDTMATELNVNLNTLLDNYIHFSNYVVYAGPA